MISLLLVRWYIFNRLDVFGAIHSPTVPIYKRYGACPDDHKKSKVDSVGPEYGSNERQAQGALASIRSDLQSFRPYKVKVNLSESEEGPGRMLDMIVETDGSVYLVRFLSAF